MSRVFVCYARKDGSFALRLAKDLRAAGVNVWMDQLSIRPGEPWDAKVEEALLQSSHVLVLLSPASLASKNVLDEISVALREDKVIFPLVLRDCRVPMRLDRLHRIDFTGEYEPARNELLTHLGVQEPPQSVPLATARTLSQRFAPAVLAAMLALLFTRATRSTVPELPVEVENAQVNRAAVTGTTESLTTNAPTTTTPSTNTTTPDFTPRQGYLGPAPAGVDARYAWTLKGGDGDGIKVIVVGGSATAPHEDLPELVFTSGEDLGPSYQVYVVAALGIIAAKHNGFGVSGIVPKAAIGASSSRSSAQAIMAAVEQLNRGDILFIQLTRAGVRANFESNPAGRGMIPIEWWPDDFAAIQFATSRGIIVVASAGNRSENLDDPIYGNPTTGFPRSWSNPFDRNLRDSGSILVSGGAPPPGTHGKDHGPDGSRLAWVNYGSAIDVQGWGEEVTTTGFGSLLGGPDERRDYTDQFSGTSSAAAMVAGVLASVQGVLRANGLPPLTPREARELLRRTGSPQQDAPGRPRSQRIGNRPNLRELIPAALALRQ